MCNLCASTPEERKQIEEGLKYQAASFERMADRLKLMASGHLKPHTQDAKGMTYLAHNLIRFLVEEFM